MTVTAPGLRQVGVGGSCGGSALTTACLERYALFLISHRTPPQVTESRCEMAKSGLVSRGEKTGETDAIDSRLDCITRGLVTLMVIARRKLHILSLIPP